MPNRTFAILSLLGLSFVGAMGWSAHHLLIVGAPTLAKDGARPDFGCLFLPLGGDFLPHFASYLFLLAIAAGSIVGVRSMLRQYRQTQTLVRSCLSTGLLEAPNVAAAARRLGLEGRLDIVDMAAPIAFCHGYLRQRVLISTGLVRLLGESEMEALLLHERAHLQQRDPLKVALGRLLTSALFFIPAISALYERYLVEKELAADRAVIAIQGDSASVTSALAKLLDHGTALGAPLAAGAADALEARVHALIGESGSLASRPNRGLAGSLAVVLVALLPLVSAPLPTGETVLSGHNVIAGCHLRGRTP